MSNDPLYPFLSGSLSVIIYIGNQLLNQTNNQHEKERVAKCRQLSVTNSYMGHIF